MLYWMSQGVHYSLGHPGIKHTFALPRECCYWPNMLNDVTSWIKHCKGCRVAKALYLGIHPIQGSLMVPDPMELAISLAITDIHLNVTIHAVTGYQPCVLMFGHNFTC